MDLSVVRKDLTARSTIGELRIDGDFQCFTLEDAVRPVKIKGVTAIPAGVYEVVINWSQRFGRLLPLLLNVPNFDGVRIHAGNTDADTEGCLLVGQSKSADFIGNSRAAFEALFAKIQKAAAQEKVFISITQDAPAGLGATLVATRATPSVRRELTTTGATKRPPKKKPAAKKRARRSSTKSAA